MNVPIEVFNIGRTAIDREEVQRWLDRLGADEYVLPSPAAASDPALLVALAAKRCYMSFQPGLNPNVSKVRQDLVEYLDNILASGHGCYDIETEVLTAGGWRQWPTVVEDDLLCTLNMQSGSIEYQKPSRLIAFQYDGPMYFVDAPSVNLLVTPDHRMVACSTTTMAGRSRKFNQYSLIKAEDLGDRPHCYLKNGKWSGDGIDVKDGVLKLLGFIIGDGSVHGKFVAFNLRRKRKIEYLRQLCLELKLNLHKCQDNFSLSLVSLPSWFEEVYNKQKEKRIPQWLLMHCSKSQLLALYDGLINSDGSTAANGQSLYDTTSKELADQFQQLCLHIGYASNISQAPSLLDRSGSMGDKRMWRQTTLIRSLRPEINKHWKDQAMVGKSSWINDYSGMVYCAEVPNHTLYVRRNGKPIWSGNSVLEHSVYTFAIEGVSRVFTGEMNRHRAGWAISEGSMRFIRFDKDIPWWMPNSIREADGDDEDLAQRKARTRGIFSRAFRQMQENYAELLDVWDLAEGHHNFKYKKRVTSCLRRIIGMGVATGGVWTGNLRELRHVIALRADEPAAEEEIFHVFSMIGQIMVDREAALFGDFKRDERGSWIPKYRKV